MAETAPIRQPDKKLAAICGLFCPACSLYIGTSEKPDRLKAMARRMNRPVEDLECQGCRAEKRSFFCRNICKMSSCAAEKGIEFCGECDEYPCLELKAFQAERPHRIELWEAHQRIREVGYETWYAEMVEHYSCPECGTINSAYDASCHQCGATPSCAYVKRHQDEIIQQQTKSK